MGEFDRAEATAKGGESKKTLAALALGAVFIGVLVYTFWSRTPQPPAGLPATGNAMLPAPVALDDSSEEAIRKWRSDLNADPTSPLLRSTTRPNPFSQTPRNPFIMDDAWQKTLLKVVQPPTPESRPLVNPDTRPKVVDPPVGTATKPQSLGVRATDYKLQSVLNGVGGWTAIINNKPVHKGDVIGDARIVEIRADSVILQNKDYPDGPTTELAMPGRAN